MYIKETISELLAEVATLKKRCQVSEEKLETFSNLDQRCKISEQKVEKLTAEVSAMSSQLASAKSSLDDLIEKKRKRRRQRNNADKMLQKLKNRMASGSIVANKAARCKVGKKNFGLNEANVSAITAEIGFADAKHRNIQKLATPQSKSRVDQECSTAKHPDNHIIVTSGFEDRCMFEKNHINPGPKESVPVTSNSGKKETEKLSKRDGARGSETNELNSHTISVADVDYKIDKSGSRNSATGIVDGHGAGTNFPDIPQAEPKSKKPRTFTGIDQIPVPNVESIIKELKAHACNMCTNTYRTEQGLRNHKSQFHSDPNTTATATKIQCSKCDKSFFGRSGLNQHYQRQHPEKNPSYPYNCTFCGKKFWNKTRIECHMRIHTGERPYPCNICHKAFISMTDLTKHVKIRHM